MDKKAQMDKSTVPQIILSIVLGITVIILFVVIGVAVWDLYNKGDCQGTIGRSAMEGIPELNCIARDVEITKGVGIFSANSDQELVNIVKQEIGKKMWECWTTVNKGKRNPYGSSYEARGGFAPLESGTTTIYLICNIIRFKNIPEFKGLDYWLMENSPASNKETFFEYLNGDRKPTAEEKAEFEKRQDSYDTSKDYVVAWKHVITSGELKNPDSVVFVPYSELLSNIDSPTNLHVVMN